MITAGELTRVLNALTVTMNDQHADRLDIDRLQQIATGALGGERKLTVHPEGSDAAWLQDDDGWRVAAVRLRDGSWQGERDRPPAGEAPVGG